MQEVAGKVVVISGATGGIGHAAAELFADCGARVVLIGRHEGRLKVAAKTIAGATYKQFDFGDPRQIDIGLEEILKTHGRIDIFVHAAGIYPTARVAEMDDSFVQSLVQVNLITTIRLCRPISVLMTQQHSGAIVNISSLVGSKPSPGLSAYAASKAGMNAFSRALALEVAPYVRVNLVSPGPTLTTSVRALMESDKTGAVAAVTRDIPMNRLAEPREVAEAIVFLASDRASYITGAELHVNGGAFMG